MDDEFINTYNECILELTPVFENISDKMEKERDGALLSAIIALRIAAKFCNKCDISKESFMDAAMKNFDLEYKPITEVQSVLIKSLN